MAKVSGLKSLFCHVKYFYFYEKPRNRQNTATALPYGNRNGECFFVASLYTTPLNVKCMQFPLPHKTHKICIDFYSKRIEIEISLPYGCRRCYLKWAKPIVSNKHK